MEAERRAGKRNLSRAGGWIRKTARRSIRKRKGVSQPGKPPHSHVGLLRRSILYGYDMARESVVVGPTPLGRRRHVAGPEAPELLEAGGTATRRTQRGRRRRMRYRARAYMGPALEKAKQDDKLAPIWADSIT